MQTLESRTSDFPDSIISFTEERVDGGVTSYVQIVSNEVHDSLESSVLMVQKIIDKATKPFTMNSISRLVTLQADIARFGPSLEEVEACSK
ncbi:hypothetical protein KI387_015326, partial [Taxus chinensis]